MASQIYGIYTALVYLTPVLGGALADRFWGQRRTVIVGALVMAAGHFMMAFEPLFLFALLLIILGNGAFKPNTTCQVGGLYALDDPRRDRAYSIFYVGINLGAFIAPFICGTLGEDVGWHYGFGAAGVGMIIATVVYIYGQRHLPPDAHTKTVAQHKVKSPLTTPEWRAIGAICLLCIFNVLFWAVYEQQGNTIALWADTMTDRNVDIFGFHGEIPASWFQSINPFFIFFVTPLLTGLWAWQARRGQEPSSVMKMAIGLGFTALSFVLMAYAAYLVGDHGKASPVWVTLHLLVLTLGELYLSPIGLSLVSKAAPIRVVSMMMGIWFLGNFAGNYMAGWLGAFWEVYSHYHFFLLMSAIAIFAAAAIWILSHLLRTVFDQPQEEG